MSLRAIAFIDYHSVYNDARDLFRPAGDKQRHGHFDPWELSSRICNAHNERFAGEQPLELGGVRVFYATPPRARQDEAHTAKARIQRWKQKHPEMGVFSHPLQLVADTEREIKKHVHTELTVGLVGTWKRSEFDVAILVSSDEESRTVARKVWNEASQDVFRLDVAGWVATATDGRPVERRILYLGGQEPRQHLLTEETYRAAAERRHGKRQVSRDHTRPCR